MIYYDSDGKEPRDGGEKIWENFDDPAGDVPAIFALPEPNYPDHPHPATLRPSRYSSESASSPQESASHLAV